MNLLELLGRQPGDRAVTRFVTALGERPQVEASDDTMCLEFRESGLVFLFVGEERLAAITVYADGADDDFAPFQGVLPHGLGFGLDQDAVHELLGEPTESVEGGNYPLLGWVAPRDVYWLPEHSVHVQYTADGDRLTQVTLMTIEDSPGRGTDPDA